jgi:hypothetical protein
MIKITYTGSGRDNEYRYQSKELNCLMSIVLETDQDLFKLNVLLGSMYLGDYALFVEVHQNILEYHVFLTYRKLVDLKSQIGDLNEELG